MLVETMLEARILLMSLTAFGNESKSCWPCFCTLRFSFSLVLASSVSPYSGNLVLVMCLQFCGVMTSTFHEALPMNCASTQYF